MTIDQIDRMFFEYIRLAAVASGNLPDVTTFSTPAAYKAAKVILGDNLIEIFGVGSSEAKETKDLNRILIERITMTPGMLGAWGATQLVKNDPDSPTSSYSKLRYPDRSMDVAYSIRTITKGVDYDRKCVNLINKALGVMGFRFTIDTSGNKTTDFLMVRMDGQRDVTLVKYIERLYNYTAVEAWLQDFEVLTDAIVPLTSISFSLYLRNAKETLPVEGAQPQIEGIIDSE